MTNKIITLTTDFETRDGYVGAMKGRILSICPKAQIHDLTHDIPPQDLLAAKLALQRSLREFNKPAVHIAVIDPGVGSSRKALAAETEAGFLVGPDNGIFSGVLEEFPPNRIFQLQEEGPCWKKHSSFDGLHLFSPVGAYLAQGGGIEEIGHPLDEWLRLDQEKAQPSPSGWMGKVLGFDRFGNALTNLPGRQAGPGARLKIRDRVLKGVAHFEEAKSLEPAAFLQNSDGMLEICVWQGSALEKLKLQAGDDVMLVEDPEPSISPAATKA